MDTIKASDYCRMLTERKSRMSGASHYEKMKMILSFDRPLSYNPDNDIKEIQQCVEKLLSKTHIAEIIEKSIKSFENLSDEKKKETAVHLTELAQSGLFPKLKSSCTKGIKYIEQANPEEIMEYTKKLFTVFDEEYNSSVWCAKKCTSSELQYKVAAIVNLTKHENVLLPDELCDMSIERISELTLYAVANDKWEQSVNRESDFSSLLKEAGIAFGKLILCAGVTALSVWLMNPLPNSVMEFLSTTAGSLGTIGSFFYASDSYELIKNAVKEKNASNNMKTMFFGNTREELLQIEEHKAKTETEENDMYDSVLYDNSHLW